MTAPVTLDMVCMFVASAPGTGSIPLGAVVPFGGVVSFQASGAVNGGTYSYYIQDGNNREFASGVYSSSPPSLTRNTIIASVNGVVQTTPINATANAIISSIQSAATLSASLASITSSVQTNTASIQANTASIQAISTAGGSVNKFRNPSLDIWQRGTSITVTTAGAYTSDGWIVVPTGASVVASQAAGLGKTANSLKITGASGVTDIVVKQRIEGSLSAPLLNSFITVQAKVLNNTGATITPNLTVRHANATDNWSASTVDVNAINLQACPNGTSTVVSYTYLDAGFANNGIEVAFDFGNNFGLSSQSIQIAECDIRAANNANVGAQSPELRPVTTELQLCQRYFQSTYGNNIAPGTATINGIASVSAANSSLSFPTTMRTAPTLNYWDGAGNANKVSTLVTGPPALVSLGRVDSTTTDATTLRLNGSADIQAGDAVVVVVTEDSTANNATSVSDGTNTYTKFAATSGFFNSGAGIDLWYCQNCQPVTNPVITATWSSNQRPTMTAVRMSGMATSGALDKSSADVNTSVTTPILTTQPEIIIAASWGTATTATISSSGWTPLVIQAAADATHFFILAYQIVHSTAAVTYSTSGWNTSGEHVEGFGSFVGGTLGDFINGITPTGALELNESNTGFVSGLGLGAMRNQSALFQYTASAEL